MKNLLRGIATTTFAISLIWSCSKDESPAPEAEPTNTAPIIEAQSFTVSESIPDSQTIGVVKANDNEDDELVFSITTNDNQLFEITNVGALSLQAGKTLDFKVTNSHEITVSVTDGEEEASASITVNVTQVDPENTAPTMENQSFEVNEDMETANTFASIVAEDMEEDELTFSLTENESELFAVSENGEISLIEGASLDFETTPEYNITIQVTDGNLSTEATITISVQDVNEAPVTDAELQFEAPEDINDTSIIGTVTATDPENDALDYSISKDDDGLFEINEDGEISLAADQNLDFETTTEHTIQVSVTDGVLTTSIDVTIVVEDVEEIVLADDPTSFVTTWETDAGEQTIYIGLDPDLVYDFTIDWGDGTVEEINEDVFLNNDNLSHTYDAAGVYTVAINGTFPAMRTDLSYFTGPALENVDKLISLDQWGNMQWERMDKMFISCVNMVYNATDNPNLSQVETMNSMFWDCESLGSPDLTNWDVSIVTDMQSLFSNATSFNGNVSNWIVSNVTNMSHMFKQTQFSGDISQWDIGSVIDMSSMFDGATSFNGDLSGWNTSNVTDMSSMFQDAVAFDQDLGIWDIGSIETMENMFDNSGMAPPNSNATLVGWANLVDQNGGPFNISLGMQNVILCGMGADFALGVLINDYSWNISGFDMQFNLCP